MKKFLTVTLVSLFALIAIAIYIIQVSMNMLKEDKN